MLAIGLLREMESTLPKMLYINWQLDRAAKDEMKDNALESLREMGQAVVQPILQVVDQANDAGQEALMEVLANYPGNEQTFQLAMKLTFIELRNAIEMLGGTSPEREFEEDPEYEALRGMDLT